MSYDEAVVQAFIEPAAEIVSLCEGLLTQNTLSEEQTEFTHTIIRNAQRFITLTASYTDYILEMHAGDAYYSIAHEWRTPLASLVGYSDLLAEGYVGQLTDLQKAAYAQMYLHSMDLRDKVQALVNFAKRSTEQTG